MSSSLLSPPLPINITLKNQNAETINKSKCHLQTLLAKEHRANANAKRHRLTELIQKFPSFALSRSQAIHWMLKVHDFHSFSPPTIILAVNYFDRFFATFGFPEGSKPWMIHLAAVACLSLAAKMDETHVPLLVDFQVEDCKYVFEAKTIQKTEILILSTLDWEMNAATPISFVEHLIIISGFNTDECFSICEDVLLQALADAEYVSFRPSVMAAAAALIVVSSLEPCIASNVVKPIFERYVDGVRLEECSRFLQRLLSKCHRNRDNKNALSAVQDSPKRVLDALFNSDDDSIDSVVTLSSSSSLSSSPSSCEESVSKKTKLHHTHENPEF